MESTRLPSAWSTYMVIISVCLLEYALTQLVTAENAAYYSNNLSIPESAEKILCRELMANYSKIGINGRPVSNTSKSLIVEFGLGLIQMDLDEKNKILQTSMWSRYRWRDEYLQWNPQDHGWIESIKLMPKELWKPDIMMYNTAHPTLYFTKRQPLTWNVVTAETGKRANTDAPEREVLAVVHFDGTVMWVPHQIFRSSCSIDVTNFPFDDQTCNMWFGSWTYNLHDIDLQLAFDQGIDLGTFMTDYKESCAWDIVNNTAERKMLPEESPTYVVLAFTLQMKRKVVFSTYILTLPCIFLAALTLVVFWLPPDRPDRTSLAMSLFASFLVLLLILVEAAPPTASSVPTLGVYYCFNMVIIMLSIFLSTLVVNISRGGKYGERLPPWLKFVTIDILGKFFCVKVQMSKYRMSPELEENSRLLVDAAANSVADKYEVINLNQRAPTAVNSNNSSRCQCACEDCVCLLRRDILNIQKNIHRLVSNLSASVPGACDQTMLAISEWKALANVMDRFFFLVYIIFIVFSLINFFPRRAIPVP